MPAEIPRPGSGSKFYGWIVDLKPGHTLEEHLEIAGEDAEQLIQDVSSTDDDPPHLYYHIEDKAGEIAETTLRLIVSDPNVHAIEPNYTVHALRRLEPPQRKQSFNADSTDSEDDFREESMKPTYAERGPDGPCPNCEIGSRAEGICPDEYLVSLTEGYSFQDHRDHLLSEDVDLSGPGIRIKWLAYAHAYWIEAKPGIMHAICNDSRVALIEHESNRCTLNLI